MEAIVIDINDREVYLEIENQLRFRSPYILPRQGATIARKDRITFDMIHTTHGLEILVHDVVHTRVTPHLI